MDYVVIEYVVEYKESVRKYKRCKHFKTEDEACGFIKQSIPSWDSYRLLKISACEEFVG